MWYSGCKGLVQGTSPSHLPRGHLPGPSGALAGSPLLPRGRQEVERVKVQGGKTDERQGMFESSKTPSESGLFPVYGLDSSLRASALKLLFWVLPDSAQTLLLTFLGPLAGLDYNLNRRAVTNRIRCAAEGDIWSTAVGSGLKAGMAWGQVSAAVTETSTIHWKERKGNLNVNC
ncbi:unnamed protein product [Rangifer tarandus platyrhynchus]|uniref:Uncharacterized protein n=1 Tax=Rangifer tarandus platyrhynchus TaxID=3082113 RepID=A0ABN8ZIU9_RANTA|nr:unnamed protein product [Rangifer tarandus platyrhynchus]